MRTLTRKELIDEIRSEVLALVDDDHSICEVAGRLGIFCKGFRRFSDEELAKRYDWIVQIRRPSSREQLEDLADRWQIARQLVQNEALACDVQTKEHDTCRGWDEFDDAKLAELHASLSGETVAVAAG